MSSPIKSKYRFACMSLYIFLLLFLTNCHKKITNSNTENTLSANYSLTDSKLVVGTCYYPWYTGGQHWNSTYMRDKLNPPQPPFLGEYDCASSGIISQHVKWCVNSKIDFWISSWWGPASSTDEVILAHHLRNKDFVNNMGYCLLYETTGRLGSLPIQVNDEKIHRFLTDLEYLIETHFIQSNYMKIDNQPVLYLYLTRTLNGNYRELFSAADSLLVRHGYNGLFIVGDEVYWHRPDKSRAQYMDAITCYNPHTSVDWVTDAEKFVVRTESEMYTPWMELANEMAKSFWVDVLPGFNDLGVRKEAQHPVIERKNGEIFEKMLVVADSILSMQSIPLKVLVITSFNEWHEDTQIEPTVVTTEMVKEPVEYTDGFGYIGYGTKYLDAVKNFTRFFTGH
ncbi:glycoside hydrolase family 99-like domain-containing protein [candidate division KSB1 bacterium]|nr:glycoside hydrolase family 99-like domain-containing protein [candidate division KSB1 bacterium]